jgi:hypothetical protein
LFAAHPGVRVKVDTFQYQRTLWPTVDKGGFCRLVVEPADFAGDERDATFMPEFDIRVGGRTWGMIKTAIMIAFRRIVDGVSVADRTNAAVCCGGIR